VLLSHRTRAQDARRWPQGRRRQPLDKAYTRKNLELLEKGLPNLLQHIENARKFGVRWSWPSTASRTTRRRDRIDHNARHATVLKMP